MLVEVEEAKPRADADGREGLAHRVAQPRGAVGVDEQRAVDEDPLPDLGLRIGDSQPRAIGDAVRGHVEHPVAARRRAGRGRTASSRREGDEGDAWRPDRASGLHGGGRRAPAAVPVASPPAMPPGALPSSSSSCCSPRARRADGVPARAPAARPRPPRAETGPVCHLPGGAAPGSLLARQELGAPDGMRAWAIAYASTGVDDEPITVTGLVLAPAAGTRRPARSSRSATGR